MTTINLYDAKNKLSQLVNAAEQGEVITIARNGKPAAMLVPLDYSGQRHWSPVVAAFLNQPASHDPAAFIVDRSDLPELQERDLF